MRPSSSRLIPLSAENLRAATSGDPSSSTFLADVIQAYNEAREHNPEPRHSLHEGHAYMLEEVDEVWQEVKKRNPDPASVYIEITHVVATAWRMAVECGLIDS